MSFISFMGAFFCLLCLCISSCTDNDSKQSFIILDERDDGRGNAFYCVYAPDSNWVEMERFAFELIKDRGKVSAVGFFNINHRDIKFNNSFMVSPEYLYNIIASYRYVKEEEAYRFFKSKHAVWPSK